MSEREESAEAVGQGQAGEVAGGLRSALTEILGVCFAVGPAHGERLDEIATIAAVALNSAPAHADVRDALELVDGVLYSLEEGTGSAMDRAELMLIRRALLARDPTPDSPPNPANPPEASR